MITPTSLMRRAGKLLRGPFPALLIFFAAAAAESADFPDNIEKISLTQRFAIAMAMQKNLDLRGDAFGYSMAVIDAARSHAQFDPVFSTSANGGVSAVPGDPFFRSRNATFSLALTQYTPIGGNITLSPQTGFTNAEIDAPEGSSTTNWQSTVGISISQPLLRNAGLETTRAGITLAENSLQESIERFRQVAADVVLSVISSYNRLYVLRQVLESKSAAVASAENFQSELQSGTKGFQQKMGIADAEFAITQRRRELVEAERSVKDQEANLRYLLGLESKAPIVPIDPPSGEEPPETEDLAVKAALAFRPELKQLELALKASELQERVSKHQSLPDLNLSASGGLTGADTGFSSSFRQIGTKPGTFWTAGMQFSVPIGNTGPGNDYLRSRIRTEQLQNQLRALKWRVQNDVEADMRALISARLQMQITLTSRKSAEQRLEEYRKNNRAGTVKVQDVLNAENDMVTARNAHLEAVEGFAYAVARLRKDMGTLLNHQGVQIDSSTPGRLLNYQLPQ